MESNFLVVIPEPVIRELESVFSYYEERQEGLGEQFLDDWETSMEHLEKRPFIHQVQQKSFRFMKLDRFPFLVGFKVKGNQILILKLIHAKRHPARRYRL